MRVSVVIPCYNGEPFLAEAIVSALCQTRTPDEVIVVDDGSTDGSPGVVSSFGEPVRLVRRPHRGISAARNTGLRAARGDLVAWLDADDVWEPQKLSLELPLFRDPAVGLVYGRHRTFDAGRNLGAPWPAELPQGDVFAALYFSCFPPNSSVVARHAALVEAGGFDEALEAAVDFDLWLRVSLRWHFAAVPAPVSRRRHHPGQVSRRRAVQMECQLRTQERHAAAFEARTGVGPAERRARILSALLEEVEAQYYVRRELDEARAMAEVLARRFPDAPPAVASRLRRIERRSRLPRVLFRVRDAVGGRPPSGPRTGAGAAAGSGAGVGEGAS